MIGPFIGKYKFLSNFFVLTNPIKYKGLLFYSVENAYQAAKCKTKKEMQLFQNITPSEVKQLGKTVELIENFELDKLHIMTYLVIQKFKKNHDLTIMLERTGDQNIVEINSWADRFWGMSNGRGENHLGRILMKIRDGDL